MKPKSPRNDLNSLRVTYGRYRGESLRVRGDAEMNMDHLLLEEWNYRREERIALLCGASKPEPWMIEMAEKEAYQAVERLTNMIPPFPSTTTPTPGA